MNRAFPLSPEWTLHDWAGLRRELVWIYDQKVRPGNLEGTDDFSVGHRAWFVRQGRVELRVAKGRPLVATRGMWLFPPSKRARQVIAPETRLLSLQFLCQRATGEPLFDPDEGLILRGTDHPELEKKASALASLVGHRFPEAHTRYGWEKAGFEVFLEVQAMFLLWLAEWYRVRLQHGSAMSRFTPRDDRIVQAIRCLNQSALDQGFPKEQLEKETCLGEAHLNRLFLQATQLSTRKYWQRRRLEFAKSCLESSGMPIKEVAWRLGFKSDSHFVIWFRNLSGKRPGQYREEQRANKV
jgi:AraC-like DNA-binding protein